MARSLNVRSHKDFRNIINFVRARYIMAGKKPPHTSEITKRIAKLIPKDDWRKLLEDEIINF